MRACTALQHVVAPCCSTLLQHVALFYGSTLRVDVRLPRPHIAGNMGVHVRRVARVRAVSFHCQASDDVARARTETAAGTGPQEGRARSGRRLALMLSRSGFRSPVGTGRWAPHHSVDGARRGCACAEENAPARFAQRVRRPLAERTALAASPIRRLRKKRL
jgi:hypothetical protein